jgi:diguanylate cyclase (GGDEF)-like protein/PAS domain S-box-containing protein
MRASAPSVPRPAGLDAARPIDTLERLALLDAEARDARTSGAMAVCLIGFVGLLLRDAAPAAAFGWWIAIVVSAAVIRTAVRWSWGRERTRRPGFPADDRILQRWEWASAVCGLGAGLCWASLVFVAATSEKVALPVALVLTLALMLASTSAFHNQMSIALFAIPIGVAQEINLIGLALAGHGTQYLVLAAVWVGVFVVLFFVKRNASATLRERLAASIAHERRAWEQAALLEDRLAAEGNYRHALRMQRLVFESAGEGIAIVNDGVIEQANQALADLLGSSMAQLTDRPLATIFEDAQEWSGIERHFQRLGTALKLERRVVRADGRAVWVNVTGRAADAADNDAAPAHPAQRSIWVFADLSVQKQKEAENWHHANHDVMTGLPNRRFLQDRLDQALASARRDGRRVAVVELDLDGFKSVNDEHGHRFGDAVIEEVARRLSTIVRDLDTVGRWGGDEFVLVLREIESADVVEETVKRVIVRLSEAIVYLGRTLSVGASIGIALYPDHGEEVEVLMLAADLAMYESKGSGGNTWRFASPVQSAARGKYRPAVSPVPEA